jgi:hypothetical protein
MKNPYLPLSYFTSEKEGGLGNSVVKMKEEQKDFLIPNASRLH